MGVSTIGGFYLKNAANNARYLHEERMGDRESRKEASERGIWIRRFIVLVMMGLLMFIVVAPAFLDINAVIIEQGWFGTKQIVVEGIVYDETIRMIITAIIGYYFGTSSASR